MLSCELQVGIDFISVVTVYQLDTYRLLGGTQVSDRTSNPANMSSDPHYKRDDPRSRGNTTAGMYERKEIDSAPAMKRRRAAAAILAEERESRNKDRKILAQFKDEHGKSTGPPLEMPHDITPQQLLVLLNKLLNNDADPLPYNFYVGEDEKSTNEDGGLKNGIEVSRELSSVVDDAGLSTEAVLDITYQPQVSVNMQYSYQGLYTLVLYIDVRT